jgi:hypothetical protein
MDGPRTLPSRKYPDTPSVGNATYKWDSSRNSRSADSLVLGTAASSRSHKSDLARPGRPPAVPAGVATEPDTTSTTPEYLPTPATRSCPPDTPCSRAMGDPVMGAPDAVGHPSPARRGPPPAATTTTGPRLSSPSSPAAQPAAPPLTPPGRYALAYCTTPAASVGVGRVCDPHGPAGDGGGESSIGAHRVAHQTAGFWPDHAELGEDQPHHQHVC